MRACVFMCVSGWLGRLCVRVFVSIFFRIRLLPHSHKQLLCVLLWTIILIMCGLILEEIDRRIRSYISLWWIFWWSPGGMPQLWKKESHTFGTATCFSGPSYQANQKTFKSSILVSRHDSMGRVDAQRWTLSYSEWKNWCSLLHGYYHEGIKRQSRFYFKKNRSLDICIVSHYQRVF